MATAPLSIGRYVLHHELGSGGMGTVHLATLSGQAGFGRQVAIKRMHPHLAKDPAFVQMFVDEARLASRLRHPSVVPVIDVVDAEGELLLVMDYVDGLSLHAILDAARECQEPLGPARAVRVAVDALAGLGAAHRIQDEKGRPLGVVHRDVSPHNLMLGADGTTRVLDFGVAWAEGKLHHTRAGVVRGKAAYLAPEQLEERSVDARTDVYAVGITLWEMLVGRRAFSRGGDAETGVAVLTAPLLAPHEVRPEIPSALGEVVARATARRAVDRYSSAEDFAEALEATVQPAPPRELSRYLKRVAGEQLSRRARITEPRLADDSPVRPATPSQGVELPAPARARRGRWVGGVLALAAGAVLTLGAFWMLGRREVEPEAATAATPPPPAEPKAAAPAVAPTSPAAAPEPKMEPSTQEPSEARVVRTKKPSPTQPAPAHTEPKKTEPVDDLLGRH